MAFARPDYQHDYPSRPPYGTDPWRAGTVSPLSARDGPFSFQQDNWRPSAPGSPAPPSPRRSLEPAQSHGLRSMPTGSYAHPYSPTHRIGRTNTVSSRGSDTSYGVPATAQVGVRFNGRQSEQPPINAYANAGALRDIDNLYGGRMMSPSPEPEESPVTRPYGHPPIAYAEPKVLIHAPNPPAHSQYPDTPLVPAAVREEHEEPTPPQVAYAGYRGTPDPRIVHRKSIPMMEALGMRDSVDYRRKHTDAFDHNLLSDCVIEDEDYDNYGDSAQAGGQARDSEGYPSRKVVGSDQWTGNRGGNGYAPAPMNSEQYPRSAGSEWKAQERRARKRRKWIILAVLGFIIAAAATGAVVGGVLGVRKSNAREKPATVTTSNSKGLYDINSSEVKAVLDNPSLHRVFPGIDYTPLNTQYPDCLTHPPDQDNITLDVAILAQLTPAVRLYGTDCNQTEMVLTAIDQLNYNSSMQVWLGLWLGNNATTNTRQVEQMYDVLGMYPSTHFAGVIVGNEVLFRKDLTEAELGQYLQDVRSNLTAKNIHLPISTSDLGDNWTSDLAANTDIIMSNIHPFFAGVTPEQAPAWANSFWQSHDVVLSGSSNSSRGYPGNIISEIGWPSQGGNDCGTESASCPNSTAGAVASIDNMNTFMDGWVCQAMANKTTYFWFESFDEPWKTVYNTPTDQWESKWGLIDSNRNVKDGLKIPDCGGKVLSTAY
ncbi:hypothetical protein LTR62_008298 [Meristemomyces frigidus]|uniref:glucan endo-1,3-beta-D-glucosidase n=1 Tax=Meristemomyces frigidus TaxID=1508187 RepID=A0AAN7YH99_9PEZI|nr:hypothetical protein LTR62_008298 [Meristemomyces frigidus]